MKLELESLHRLHEAEARAAETRQELERVRLQTEIELAEASNRFDEERHGSNSVLSRSELQRRDFGQGPLDYTADWVEKTSAWDPVDHLPLFVDERHSSLSKLPARPSPVVARTDDAAATTGRSLLMERALGLPRLDIPKFNEGTATEYRRFRSLFRHVFDDFPTMSEERKFRYLCSYVQGRAYRVIFPFENTDKPFTRALAALDKRYGRMDVLTDEVMTKIERLPAVTEKDLDALHDFSLEVNSMISLMEAVGQRNEIRSTMLLHRLLSKLPESRQLEFRRHCLARGISTSATTFDLGKWLEDLEEAILMVRPPESTQEGRDDTFNKESTQANRSSSERSSLVDIVWRAIKAIEYDRIMPVLQASSLVIAVFQIPGTLLGEEEGMVPVREAMREVRRNCTSDRFVHLPDSVQVMFWRASECTPRCCAPIINRSRQHRPRRVYWQSEHGRAEDCAGYLTRSEGSM